MISLDPFLLSRLPSSARLLIALSGGLDSTALLHWLSQYRGIDKARLHAMHVHHGLHSDADQWAAQCQRFCSVIGVPMQIVNVDVARDGGEGLEAAARKARYAAFATAMNDDDVLVTAHHRDDQAETFLLRALRASGPDGLASMRPWRRFGSGWHWRPLLDVPRSGLLAHAREHGLAWVDDPSNADTAHDRNFLRQRVMPLLRERWPQVDAAFARSAALSAGAVELLADEDADALASARTADGHALSTDALKQLPVARRARVLRHWIAALGLPSLPAEGVAQIESQLLVAQHDTQAEFAWSGAIIRRWRDVLHVDLERDPLPADWRMEWDGTSPLRLPTGDVLRLESLVAFEAWHIVHARQGGGRIVLPGRDHSHSLKHVLQELGVPPWQRERLPLLSDASGELLAIGDLAYSAGFDAWLRQHDARVAWIKAGD
ncbi:MAG: tRNA lysidine(34) synthetase TilS [Lysobacter sp.]|nr:tRNA lysidine(34) synthetase TilS [Lysobacter sp.]